MTNVGSFEGLATLVLIFIVTCVLLRRVRALRPLTEEWKTSGPLSLLHKASVIGLRLKPAVAGLCFSLGSYILFFKRSAK